MTLVFFLSSCEERNTESFKITKGKFSQTLTETGELAAVNAKSFVLPMYGRYWYRMKIIGMLEHGSLVEVGDSIIQFDPAEIKKFIIEKENDWETQKAILEKLIVQQENRKSELRSSLLTEQASFDLKKLELEQSQFETERKLRMKHLEFEQAKIRLNKVKQQQSQNDIIAKNELRIQQIKVNRIEKEVSDAYKVVPTLTLRTPIPGIFQIAKKRRSSDLIKVGDEVYVGNALGNVPDLTWMKVNTIVNELDFMKVELGQKVKVRLDALPSVVFEGEVSFVSKLCRSIGNNSRQKVFDVEVKMLTSDERLKPGMTVSCEYLCAELEDVYSVPVQGVETVGKDHYIYLKKGMKTQRQKVEIGPSNNTSVVISGSFKKGDRIVPINQITEQKTN
jgi:multidrug efflux pump subunit AcrA (membrane-fusion protein)